MATVTLTMTTEQAAALCQQLDLAVRISLCQFREIEHIARMGRLKHRTGRELNDEERYQVESACKQLSDAFGFSPNASFGIGSPHVSTDAHRGYEIKKVVEKALAEYRDPNPQGMRGVNYDGLIVRYTSDPEPVATVMP